ncbi:MAG: TRAP transporter small permease subunit, partial [Sphingomonadales bacterium]|nr:TRAP transporter small permease subunit [Sphingomonadales bacterium]
RVGSIMVQESLLYINAFLFLTAAGVTLLEDGHVRVDIFYRGASRRYKARVDFWGTAVFLIPVLALLWVYGLPYVVNSWAELEGSIETGGLPAVFLLKTLILFAAATLSLQAVALLLRSWLTLREAS